jgi:hypothetical protein
LYRLLWLCWRQGSSNFQGAVCFYSLRFSSISTFALSPFFVLLEIFLVARLRFIRNLNLITRSQSLATPFSGGRCYRLAFPGFLLLPRLFRMVHFSFLIASENDDWTQPAHDPRFSCRFSHFTIIFEMSLPFQFTIGTYLYCIVFVWNCNSTENEKLDITRATMSEESFRSSTGRGNRILMKFHSVVRRP